MTFNECLAQAFEQAGIEPDTIHRIFYDAHLKWMQQPAFHNNPYLEAMKSGRAEARVARARMNGQ